MTDLYKLACSQCGNVHRLYLEAPLAVWLCANCTRGMSVDDVTAKAMRIGARSRNEAPATYRHHGIPTGFSRGEIGKAAAHFPGLTVGDVIAKVMRIGVMSDEDEGAARAMKLPLATPRRSP